MALAIAQADELVHDRLTKCGADPDAAFTFKWLSEHAEILWLHCRLNVDFDIHMDKMFKPVTLIPTLVIDPDRVIEWQMKKVQHWLHKDDQYLCHQVLLLGQVQNRSRIKPPGEPDMIFCCMVVWIHHNQATIMVPLALEHLTTVIPQDQESLTLCKILNDVPFWPSPPSDNESYLITLSGDDAESLFGGPPQAFRIYCGITYRYALSFRTFMSLNKMVSGKADIQTDEAAFYYIKPQEVLWVNDLYVTVGKDDQNIPAVNPLYLVGPDSILLNPVLEFNPTIALAVAAAFEEEPIADAQAVKVTECIVMVGRKGRDQESDSASSLTVTITNVKIELPDQGTIPEDTNTSQSPEGTEDAPSPMSKKPLWPTTARQPQCPQLLGTLMPRPLS